MFRLHVESWLDCKDDHVVDYINVMLNNGHDTLTDFQNECKLLSERMALNTPYGVEFMYNWSVRSWLEEVIKWYVPEAVH